MLLREVRKITGMVAVAGWFFNSLSTWKPSMPGMVISRMIRSGLEL